MVTSVYSSISAAKLETLTVFLQSLGDINRHFLDVALHSIVNIREENTL